MNHIMELLPKFKVLIEKLEDIKHEIVKQSGISYTSQDARMVALDSIQISISAVGMWIST
jgi:predicted oxidoreductase (fatty acid repression mutant protein)